MMPLLQTKLYAPRVRREIVPRSRLIERLNAGLQGKLTLISAPAGFGKTTLLSEWIHATARSEPPRQTAWLSLDENDNDPARFWAYMLTALNGLAAGVADQALTLLPVPQAPSSEAILTTLLNGLATLSGRLLVLVLDDYHMIEAPSIHQGVGFLLEHLPPQLHLVLCGRADPPFPLANLRAGALVNELRINDLRFTAQEAAVFLNQVMGLALSAPQVTALEARTEGWIAGLQLAALSMRDQDAKGIQDLI
jgi:LuxR family maltose regulon positive regulatory protein